MNILVPVNNKEHIKNYIESGATELYIGFYDEEWDEKFGQYADINRLTGYRRGANPFSFDELLNLIKPVHDMGGSLYVTFNCAMYSQKQLDYMERYMEALSKARIDGVIVSCPDILVIAAKYDLFCVVSTIAGCYNSDIVKFYRDCGAGRIIIPRDVSLNNMKEIIKVCPEPEYEVFMMRCGCMFSDSNCLGMHRNEYCSFCLSLRDAPNEVISDNQDFSKRSSIEFNNQLFQEWFHYYSCGLCGIYEFLKMNITAGKIVGRGDDWKKICDEIRSVAENIRIAKTCTSNEEYLKNMYIPNDRRQRCKMGLSCYYPEIRF